MKKLILTATFLVAGVFSTLAQGDMEFSNAPWEAWPDSIDRLVYKTTIGVDPVDDATWSAQLVQNVGGNWVAVGDRANFFGAGLEGIWASDGIKRIVTTPSVQGSINVAVEIYDGAGTMLVRNPFTFTQGASVPPSPTDNLPIGLRAFVVPEPSTIALGVLGLGALLLFRRRK